MAPVRRSTAARVWVGERCEYRTVMAMLLCPKSSWTVRKSTPAITSRLAKVCRRQCQEKARILALLTIGSNQYRGPGNDWPSGLRITAPVPSPRVLSVVRASSAALFSGTCLVSPFLERGTVSTRRGAFTFSQVKPYSSLSRRPVFKANSNSGMCSGQPASIAARKRTSSSGASQLRASIIDLPVFY